MTIQAYNKIVVVMEENHDYSQIVGSPSAPYINNTLIAGGALLTNYDDLGHPSLPNYFGLYGGSTFGVSDDNFHAEPDPSLGTILQGAGKTFTGYAESPYDGVDHQPWLAFPEGSSVQKDFSQFPTTSAGFAALPNVSFVIPNVNDDMHNGTVAQGDTWLQSHINAYAQWAKANSSLLVVQWDEGSSTDHVPSIWYGANIVPGSYSTAYNHYNLTATISASEGVTGPRNAASAGQISGIFSGSTTVLSHGVMTHHGATEGTAFAGGTTIATFQDSNLTDDHLAFTAWINWGDGTSTGGTVIGSNGTFSVTGGHDYIDEGANLVSVSIVRIADGQGITPTGTLTVAEADNLIPFAQTVNGTVGQPVSGTLATFSDPGYPNNPAGDFATTITWGDGSPNSVGQVIDNGSGTFSVTGTHTYNSTGFFNLDILFSDPAPGTQSVTAHDTAHIQTAGTAAAAPVTSLHYAPNGNFDHGAYNAPGDPGADGFNLADVTSVAQADALPTGDKGLIWTGDTLGLTTGFENTVNAAANDPNVYGFYTADEPGNSLLASVLAMDDYVHAHAPGKMAFIVGENNGTPQAPVYGATPGNTHADLIGLDPYPVRPQFSGGIDLSVIDAGVSAASAAGWTNADMVPVYQAFGNGTDWTLPTATQENQILAEWGKLTPTPAFDYAYEWGLNSGNTGAISTSTPLQSVFSAHNA